MSAYGSPIDRIRTHASQLFQGGRLEEAANAYRNILEMSPSDFDAIHHLGLVAVMTGRMEEARRLLQAALDLSPTNPEVWLHYGMSLQHLGRADDAVTAYERALGLRPDYSDAMFCLGVTQRNAGRRDKALVAFNHFIALRGSEYPALLHRGDLLREAGDLTGAMADYESALTIKPDYFDAWMRRGVLLGDQGRDEALECYDKAAAIAPERGDVWYNRGVTLQTMNRTDEALAAYDQSVALKPDFTDAWNNRGVVLRGQGRLDDAMASFRRALGIDPRHADSLANHGAGLQAMKRFEEAAGEFRRLELLAPEHKYLLSGLLLSAMSLCDWQTLEDIEERLKSEVLNGKSIAPPLPLMGLLDDPALHQAAAAHYFAEAVGSISATSAPKPGGHDRIRLGYVSNDFYAHATARLMADLFERHDRGKFEVIAISYGPQEASDIRDRLLKSFDQFHDVRAMTDTDVAELMRKLEIDIAIDLKGFTGDARPGIFARRPAPVSVNYLGYPGTIGGDFMDYVLADAVVLPMNQQPFYAEQIVHLPGSYQANDPKRAIASPPSRPEAGLPADGLVFCCFNNHWKITRPLFESWMRILKAVPDSVLWLLSDSADANLARAAEAEGVDPMRVVFAPRLPHADHLGRLGLADLVLDTLPYNAHTTASDALWCGVPVLTIAGQSFAARVAASLNTAIGLADMVAGNLAAYEEAAVALAKNPKKLTALKTKLALNRGSTPLFDAPAFCKAIEAAYTRIFEAARRGEAPKSFALSQD